MPPTLHARIAKAFSTAHDLWSLDRLQCNDISFERMRGSKLKQIRTSFIWNNSVTLPFNRSARSVVKKSRSVAASISSDVTTVLSRPSKPNFCDCAMAWRHQCIALSANIVMANVQSFMRRRKTFAKRLRRLQYTRTTATIDGYITNHESESALCSPVNSQPTVKNAARAVFSRGIMVTGKMARLFELAIHPRPELYHLVTPRIAAPTLLRTSASAT